ncbi:MAG TPA: hypothetical protein VMY88_01630 [Acidimicrobiales bacterium]|nr:hypothetical protein [Acidimicrobiales bacterium]
MRRAIAALAAGFLMLATLSTLPAQSVAVFSSPNMTYVAGFKWRSEGEQRGTDLEFATIRGRDYAFAGTYVHGMQVIDITDPRHPEGVGEFECGLAQGDVQVFRQGSRWLATYTADNGYGGAGGDCYKKLGVARGTTGTFIADVTDPTKPRAVGFLPIILGSHNMTVHPGGRFLYNSDSEFPGRGQVEIWDIADPSKPKRRSVFDLLPVPGAVNDAPSSSHDITFNVDGTRAYVAALHYTVILDTTTPAAPVALSWIPDPAITLHHQSDPVTFQTAAGPITYLVITDELGGGQQNTCPGGGLHVYNITGPLELAPVKVGAFFAPFVGESPARACTSHVLRMHPEEAIMTIGWYGLGSRVIDISGLIGLSAGPDETTGTVGPAMREVGYLRFANSDTWTAKTNRIAPDGSFYLYANDHERGFEVLRYTPPPAGLLDAGPGGMDPGRWLSPAEVLEETLARRAAQGDDAPNAPYCVLPFLAA